MEGEREREGGREGKREGGREGGKEGYSVQGIKTENYNQQTTALE